MERLVSRLRGGILVGIGGLAIVLIVVGLVSITHAAPTITASIEPKSFGVNEAATLSLTIQDGSGEIEQLPEVPGLHLQQRGQSSQHQWINGSSSSSKTFLVQVTADRPGNYTIPPVSLSVDGKAMKTVSLTVQVTAAAAAPLPDVSGQLPTQRGQGANDQTLPAFLRMSPVKEQSFVGEVLPVEIKAYFRRGLRANLNSRPQLNGDGFVLNLSGKEPTQTEEVVDGVPYAVLSWPATLSGIRKGEQRVSLGVEASMFLPDNSQRRRAPTGDPFFDNDLFADFFNQHAMQERKINLVSKEITLQVNSLPEEGRPADFSGAIGHFELEVTARPTKVNPGEPITLTMTVRGVGNLEQLNAPALSRAEEWKTYTPSAKVTPGISPGEGSKVFEQVIIAKDAGQSEIPPLVFSFFDPQTKEYKTLRSAPIPLESTTGANLPVPGGGGSAGSTLGTQELQAQHLQGSKPVEQKTSDQPPSAPSVAPAAGDQPLLAADMGTLRPAQAPLLTRSWFQVFVAVVFLALVIATLLKRQALRRAGDPVASRRQEQERLLHMRLLEIRTACEKDAPREFFALCRKCIQEQLGLLWQMGPEAITGADLRGRLAGDSPLIDLFALAEGSMYGGGAAVTSVEMRKYAEAVEAELRRLR